MDETVDMKTRAWAWFRIVRPPIVTISILGSFVGLFQVDSGAPFEVSFLVALGATLLAAGMMVHNDVTDYESDRHNRPHKPIPRGVISLRTANISGLAFMFMSVLVALFTVDRSVPVDHVYRESLVLGDVGLNLELAALTFVLVIVAIRYNIDGKRKGIWGHVMVAFGVAAIPLYGALALGSPLPVLPLFIGLFIMEIGREIMVCVQDIEGDRVAGFDTHPIRVGPAVAKRNSLLLYLGFLPFFPLAFLASSPLSGVFGALSLFGGLLFFTILIVTWLAVRDTDDFERFERFIRTGTRVGVLLFQVLLLVDALTFSPLIFG